MALLFRFLFTTSSIGHYLLKKKEELACVTLVRRLVVASAPSTLCVSIIQMYKFIIN